ncbi:hypothetical protein ACHWQZ_G019546 [Mnemiopsis leidyi]
MNDDTLDDWTVSVEFTAGTKTTAQSNEGFTKISCMAKTGGETSTGSRNFYCPSRTAANVLSIAGTSDAVKLAEVVIVGAAWNKYKCDKGYYNTGTGFHASSGQDCQICSDGYHNDQFGQQECTPCLNPQKNVYYTNDFAHKSEAKCQVCDGYTVANAVQDACEACPAGKEYQKTCAVFDPNDKAVIDACTSIACSPCLAGQFRAADAAVSDSCQDCAANQYSSSEADKCEDCPKHKYSDPGSATCTDCSGKTYEDVKTTDVPVLEGQGKLEQLFKCFRDTDKACAETTVESVYGTYDPEWAKVGENKTFDCQYDCDNDTEKGCKLKAVFSCQENAQGVPSFKKMYYCIKTNTTKDYEEIIKATNKTTVEKAKDFKKLSEETNSKNGLGDLEQAANLIDVIVKETTEEVNETVMGNIVEGVSNILDGDLGTDNSKKSDILNSVVGNLTKITSTSTNDNKLVTSKHIAAVKVTGSGSTGTPASGTMTFSLPSDNSDLTNLNKTETGDAKTDTVLMVTAQESGKAKDVAIVIFQKSQLFPDSTVLVPDPVSMKEKTKEKTKDGTKADRVVNSLIVEVSALESSSSDKDFSLGFYMKPIANVGARNYSVIAHSDGTKSQLQNRCHSFNTDKGVWEEDCQTVYDQNDPDSKVLCLCKHNTSFAVLMSPYEIDPGYLESQTLMSMVIMSLAIICLVLTIAFLLPAAPLRKQRSTKINICFSFSLLLATLLFLLQNALVKSDNSGVLKLGSTGCIVFAALQHYLWLVVFLWMVVEGVLMYLSLVQVFGSHISKYMLKFNLLCWGVPIFFPIIGYFAFTKTETVGDYSVVTSDYIADNMCFLKPGSLPFWIFFFLPLILVLLVNVVFFVLVFRVIKDSKSVQASERELILRQIKAAIGVMVLLGTGWLIGIFMTIPHPGTQISLQYLFILINSSQGICVFLFYVILNEQVKNHWFTVFGIRAKVSSSSGNSAAATNTGTKATSAKSTANNPKTENVYENAAAVGGSNDHTYDTAFPAKSDENGRI